ncbi:30S ribosomal protein S6 [Thermodesulfobacteriota bacterium]
MRRYETIFIVDPDLSEEDRAPIFSRLNDLIPQEGGFLVMQDDWGLKRLAYEIKKKPRGYYVRLDYCGTGALVDEMERFFRIDDRVLKYMTVLLDKDVDVEGVKEEMARAASEAEAAEQAASVQPQDEPVQNDEPDADPGTDDTPDDETVETEITDGEDQI